ncbi:MAG: TetR/AcrR family transcriptional regulator [Pseudomonadota bacterium]
MATEKTREKIITAFMALVAEEPWDAVTMPAIAKATGIKLDALRAAYDSRLAILEDFSRRTDVVVLKGLDPNLHEEKIRDRFFEVLMQRFDALAPYKAGLRALARQARRDPLLGLALARSVFRSQGWMVMATGLGADGLDGAARTQAVTMAYLETLRVWLDDDEPGMAKTMAALDRALRTAERRLGRLARLGRLVMPGRFGSKRSADNDESEFPADDAAAGTA